MNQSHSTTYLQYAVQPSLPYWGDLEGWVGMYYYSARYYAPPTFISRDPMFEKYPSISPYTYCGNNPVLYIDPNGKEKLIGFSKNDKTQSISYNAADKQKDIHNNIKIFAHGSSGGFTYFDNKTQKEIEVHDVDEFKNFLNDYSSEWKNRKEGEPIVITFQGCRIGKEGDDNFPSFAQLCSEDKDFKNVTFIAADEYVFSKSNGTYNVQDADYKNSEYIKNGKIGNWKVFMNGKNTWTFNSIFTNPNVIAKALFKE